MRYLALPANNSFSYQREQSQTHLRSGVKVFEYNKYEVLTVLDRSSQRSCSMLKGVLRNFTKFTGKHPCQSLFFNKVVGPATLLKSRLCHRCQFYEISKNIFFTERLWMTASKAYHLMLFTFLRN